MHVLLATWDGAGTDFTASAAALGARIRSEVRDSPLLELLEGMRRREDVA